MQINSNSISFSGGFKLKGISPELKEKIPNVVTKNRQIFYNIDGQNDQVFIATRDYLNSKVAKFITEHNLKFEFYPEINTKCGLDDQKPEVLFEILKKAIPYEAHDVKNITSGPRPKPKKTLSKLLTNLSNSSRLNIEKPKIIKNDKSVTVIRDDAHRRTFNLIGTQSSHYYVSVIPDSITENSIYMLLDGKGRVVKEITDIDQKLSFMSKFRELKHKCVNSICDLKLS